MTRFTRPGLCWFGLTLAFALPARAEEAVLQPDAAQILQKVRESYSHLKDYHFEHQLVVSVEQPTEKEPKTLADVALTLAVADATPVDKTDTASSRFPTSMRRCRIRCKSDESSMVLVSNEEEAFFYIPPLKQYKRSTSSMRAIGGPTSATMFLAANMVPLAVFTDSTFHEPRLAGEETLRVGDTTVKCHVIEARIVPTPAGDTAVPENPFVRPSDLSFLLTMHGLTGGDLRSAPIPSSAAKERPVQVTLWIDQREPKVWKSRLEEPLEVPAGGVADQAVAKISFTDTYSVIQTKGPLPEDLFRFEPPQGAEEVDKLKPR